MCNGEDQSKKKHKFYYMDIDSFNERLVNPYRINIVKNNECGRNWVWGYKEFMPRVSVKTRNYIWDKYLHPWFK